MTLQLYCKKKKKKFTVGKKKTNPEVNGKDKITFDRLELTNQPIFPPPGLSPLSRTDVLLLQNPNIDQNIETHVSHA